MSKEQSGNEWLDYYLTSPVWHFSLSAGVCCEQAVVGTLIPSVDNVGRHYPFTLAGFHQQAAVCGWHENEWSTQFEAQILQVLEDDINLETWLNDVSGQQYTIPVTGLCSSQSESSDITKKAWVIQEAMLLIYCHYLISNTVNSLNDTVFGGQKVHQRLKHA